MAAATAHLHARRPGRGPAAGTTGPETGGGGERGTGEAGAGANASSWSRMRCSSWQSSGPGCKPSSKAKCRRHACMAARASDGRPAR